MLNSNNNDDELFVPALADTSEFVGFEPPLSSQNKTDENYWRTGMESAAEHLPSTADVTLESLLDPPISGRNIVTPALDSNRDGILSGLYAMKSRINALENQQTDSRRNFLHLQNATDTYTKLLQRKPSDKNVFPVDNSREDGDLLNDKDIQSIYDRLQLRLRHLEMQQKRLTNSHSDQDFRSSSVSDVEKMRGAPTSNDAKNFLKEIYATTDADVVPVRDFGGRKSEEEIQPKPISSNATTSGSSRSLKINEKQREKLTAFSEKLRSGDFFPPASSSPLPTRKIFPTVADESIQCEICRLDKSTQCICRSFENRTEKWAQTSFPRGNRVAEPSTNGVVDYQQLRRQLLALKHQAAERKLLNPTKESTKETTVKRPVSAPSSPVHKLPKQEIWDDSKKPAFVAGTSTESSHSIMVNLQELLAILKQQNPSLYQICLKIGANVTALTLAQAFETELKHMKQNAQQSLLQKLKLYDELNREIQTCSARNSKRKTELMEQRDALVTDIERTDTYIQRLNVQAKSLDILTKKAEALINRKKKQRSCNNLIRPRVASLGALSTGNDFVRHTVASRQKAVDPKQNRPTTGSRTFSAQQLKEIKLAKNILSAV